MAFHDVRLPLDIERGAQTGPVFATDVIAFANGREQRNSRWSFGRWRGDAAYGIDSKENYSRILAHFRNRRGRAHSFPFRDWSDYELDDYVLGVGDDVTTDFQLVRVYDDGTYQTQRPIYRPIADTIIMALDGVETSAFSIQPLGIIRFNDPVPLDVVVTASGEFDIEVRYDTDTLPIELELVDAGRVPPIPLVEVLPEAE